MRVFRFWMSIIIMMFPLVANAALMYSSEEIRGTIIDSETEQPVEGVVVIAEWTVKKMILAFVGDAPGNRRTLVKLVAVTDKDGKYVIPAWGPKPVLPLEFMEGKDGATISTYKIGYWNKYLSDIEPDVFSKRYDLSKLDNKQLINKGRSFNTQFEEAIFNAIPYEYVVPSHRKSMWNGRTIRIKKIIPGEELRFGDKVTLCADAKKKYGEDIKCDGPYFKEPIIEKVTEKDLYEQMNNLFRDKNTCRDILKQEPNFSQEIINKYHLRRVLKECREIMKEDVK